MEGKKEREGNVMNVRINNREMELEKQREVKKTMSQRENLKWNERNIFYWSKQLSVKVKKKNVSQKEFRINSVQLEERGINKSHLMIFNGKYKTGK